jgi:hypothetical protein
MGIHKHAAIFRTTISRVEGFVIVGSADSDDEIGAFKVDRGTTGRKGRIGGQVIEQLDLALSQVLGADDALDACK